MQKIKDLIKRICFILFRLFPIQRNKVFFNNYFGRGYGCNPKYIAEALHQLYPNLDLVWEVRNDFNKDFPEYIRTVRYESPKAIWERATSKIWVQNTRCTLTTAKRKGQFYIQTWHGAIGVKRCEGDAGTKIHPKFLKIAKHDSPMIDLMVSNSRFCTQVYERGFWYNGPIAEFGYPRNDLICDCSSEVFQRVRNYFHLSQEKKIFFYAPTFRKDAALWDSSSLDIHRLLESFKKTFGGDWICLLRLHPWAAAKCAGKVHFDDKILDATYYPDIQELLATADTMATDYSSCIFDFLISRKPAFMFAPDIQDYIEERGLLFDPYQLPFSCAEDNDSLERNVLNFNKETYQKQVNEFFETHLLKDDGKASERVAHLINGLINGKTVAQQVEGK